MPSNPPKVRALSEYGSPDRSHNPPEQPVHRRQVATSAAKGAAEGALGGPEGIAVGAARGAAKGATQSRKPRATGRGMRLGTHHLLIAEFLVCFLVLGLSPLVGDVGPGAWMKKGTATAMLFVALSLIGETGPKTKNAVTALGGLVTLTVLITHRDIFTMIAGKFGSGQDQAAVDAGEQSAAQGGAPVDINTPQGQQTITVVPQPGGGFIAGNSVDF